MPITIKNSAGGGVTLDSTTSSNETLQLPSGGGTLTNTTDLALKAPIASPVFTGNVGVGVTPEAWGSNFTALDIGAVGSIIGGTANDWGTEVLSNAYYDTGYKYKTTDDASTYSQANGTHAFRVAPSGTADAAISWTTAMTISNTRRVGIHGNTHALTGIEESLNVSCNRDSGGNDLGIFVSGNRQAGNHTSMRFYNNVHGVTGSITHGNNTSTSYNTSSDYRLKTDVQPMTGAADRVKLLKPCNFEWIVDGTRVDGFIAHEAQEVVPESVTGTKDAMRDEEYEVTAATYTEEAVMGTRSVPDMQGIDQSKLVPLLTATIQELIARIEALENV